jgi:hypothetical protein
VHDESSHPLTKRVSRRIANRRQKTSGFARVTYDRYLCGTETLNEVRIQVLHVSMKFLRGGFEDLGWLVRLGRSSPHLVSTEKTTNIARRICRCANASNTNTMTNKKIGSPASGSFRHSSHISRIPHEERDQLGHCRLHQQQRWDLGSTLLEISSFAQSHNLFRCELLKIQVPKTCSMSASGSCLKMK